MEEEKDSIVKETSSRKIIIGFVIFILIVLGLNYYFLVTDVTNRGSFGDMFGVSNAIFSGAAFLGVVYAIYLQTRELNETQRIMELQKEELKSQAKVLARQNFESSFFNLLKLSEEIVQSAQGGVNAFDSYMAELLDTYNYDSKQQYMSGVICDEKELIKNSYEKNYIRNERVLGRYFGNLGIVFEFIDKSNVEDKRFYIDVVRNNMSHAQIGLLFYHALYRDDLNYKQIIESYAMLQNLDINTFANVLEHAQLYDRSAYGNNRTYMEYFKGV